MPPKQNPKAAAPSASSNSNRAYLECTEGSSNKFYEIVFNEKDSSVFTRYGPIGKDGVSATKNFKSKEEARKFYDKTLQEKLKKGSMNPLIMRTMKKRKNSHLQPNSIIES